MIRWEYKIIDTKNVPSAGFLKGKSPASIEAYLNELGEQGWEIVNIDALELQGCMEFAGVAKREKIAD